MKRPAHVAVLLGWEHAADPAAGTIRPEEEPSGSGSETPARKIAPAVPAFMIRIGSRATGDGNVLQPLRLIFVLAHAARSAINFLVSAIALAGLRPFGHTFAQFMIV